MAERYLLERMAKGDLMGTIIRVGYLEPRTTDGKMPPHAHDNLLTTILHAISDIGGIPASARKMAVSSIAIDQAAARIDDIVATPLTHPVWHVDDHWQRLAKLAGHHAGKPLPMMSDETFLSRLHATPRWEFLTPLFEAMLHTPPHRPI